MTVPRRVILLVLDAYPLRRIGGRRLWTASRPVVLEKLPFFLLSLAAGITALVANQHTHVPSAAEAETGVSLIEHVAISAYALAFYLGKIAVPVALSARYELPPRSGFDTWPGLLSGA